MRIRIIGEINKSKVRYKTMKLFMQTPEYVFKAIAQMFGTVVPRSAYADRPTIDFKYLSTFDTRYGEVDIFTN